MTGKEIYDFTCKLFPINRFLMGMGVRETLLHIKKILPEMNIFEIPSGTKVYDWIVPDEWEITDAYIEDEAGNKIIDFHHNNLHVMAYSEPVDQWMTLDELKQYVYTDKLNPDAIPYVTSYYKKRTGVCMSQNQLGQMDKGKYHLFIDSCRKKGSMSYGEAVLEGETKDEILFHSVVCHPSLANDELSGVALAAFLAREIKAMGSHYYTYRFIFVPETIGAIAYLSKNLSYLKKHVKAGYILSCEGDDLSYSYLPTIMGNTLADRAAVKVLKELHPHFKSYSFLERGSDERQYNSPGVDIPVCLVCRSKAGEFPEYHTSNDNLQFVSPEGFQGSFELFMRIVKLLEANRTYKTKVLCEPQLGRRGLYSDLSCRGSKTPYKTIIDFLAYSNGHNDLIAMSDILGVPLKQLEETALVLLKNDLIEIV